MRVLLIAPTCDRDDIGEAWVAHQWAARLSERHEVTVLTYHKVGRGEIAPQLPRARVVEWVEPRGLGRAERLNSLLKPGYVPFYLRARRWIRAALARGETFDVVHQPVPVAMRYPSPATGLGIPLVMGPVGGGMDSPSGFDAEDTAPWYVRLRSLDRLRLRRDPLLRRTYEQATCVLGIAPYVAENLAGLTVRRFEVMGETGLIELPPARDRVVRAGPLRLLFVGRLIRTKGARDAVAAMGHLRHLEVTLDLLGDGFDRGACEDLARHLGIGDRVRFHGAVPHAEALAAYQEADVFLFPSYREPGGNVAFEAMGASIPLIVADRGGPGFVVDDRCGIRVSPLEPEQYARDLAAAVSTLAGDPELRLAMGRAAHSRLAEVGLWSAKLDAIDRLYEEVVAG